MLLFEYKNIIIFGMIAFLVMSFWTLYSMPTDEGGSMVNCPFMNDYPGFCQMTLNEHISFWQQMFAIIRLKELIFLPFSLLIITFFVLYTITEKIYYKLKSQSFYNYLYQHKPEIKIFNHILLAFSRGIIHPKVYA